MSKKRGRPPKEETKKENKTAETLQDLIDGKPAPNMIDVILNRISEKYYIKIEINPPNHVDRNGWNVYLEKRKN